MVRTTYKQHKKHTDRQTDRQTEKRQDTERHSAPEREREREAIRSGRSCTAKPSDVRLQDIDQTIVNKLLVSPAAVQSEQQFVIIGSMTKQHRSIIAGRFNDQPVLVLRCGEHAIRRLERVSDCAVARIVIRLQKFLDPLDPVRCEALRQPCTYCSRTKC